MMKTNGSPSQEIKGDINLQNATFMNKVRELPNDMIEDIVM